MSGTKVSRRRVVGTIAMRLERVAAIWPRDNHTLAARIEGPTAARALAELADVLRTLEDEGTAAAWACLEDGYGVVS